MINLPQYKHSLNKNYQGALEQLSYNSIFDFQLESNIEII